MVISAPPASRHELEELVVTMGAELDGTAREVGDAIHAHLDEIDDDLYPRRSRAAARTSG